MTMLAGLHQSARQANEQTDRQNKYAQVMKLAADEKRKRSDLESDDWIFRRANAQALPPSGD